MGCEECLEITRDGTKAAEVEAGLAEEHDVTSPCHLPRCPTDIM